MAGGSSGIGLATVQLLSQQGAHVYVISRNPAAEWPPNVNYIAADVEGALNNIENLLPEKLDGLVYAVGSINLKPFGRLTDEDFLRDYNINVVGAMRVIQKVLKPLKNAGNASIVLISSVAAKIGMPYHASIAAAKGAIEGFALALAAELAGQQIRVNVISPSLTNTRLSQNLLNSAEKMESSAKRHPLGRYGQPDDISEAIMFLLSDKSTWITGQIIGIDGGMGNLKSL